MSKYTLEARSAIEIRSDMLSEILPLEELKEKVAKGLERRERLREARSALWESPSTTPFGESTGLHPGSVAAFALACRGDDATFSLKMRRTLG